MLTLRIADIELHLEGLSATPQPRSKTARAALAERPAGSENTPVRAARTTLAGLSVDAGLKGESAAPGTPAQDADAKKSGPRPSRGVRFAETMQVRWFEHARPDA